MTAGSSHTGRTVSYLQRLTSRSEHDTGVVFEPWHRSPPLILVTSFQAWAGRGGRLRRREPERESDTSVSAAVPLRQTLSKGSDVREREGAGCRRGPGRAPLTGEDSTVNSPASAGRVREEF